jgi:hypothetical protein
VTDDIGYIDFAKISKVDLTNLIINAYYDNNNDKLLYLLPNNKNTGLLKYLITKTILDDNKYLMRILIAYGAVPCRKDIYNGIKSGKISILLYSMDYMLKLRYF